jgi:hypothetical protein
VSCPDIGLLPGCSLDKVQFFGLSAVGPQVHACDVSYQVVLTFLVSPQVNVPVKQCNYNKGNGQHDEEKIPQPQTPLEITVFFYQHQVVCDQVLHDSLVYYIERISLHPVNSLNGATIIFHAIFLP